MIQRNDIIRYAELNGLKREEVMLHKENPLTGDWLCWIPDTPQAYYYSTKKKAKEFCDKVNKAFDVGELKFDGVGRVVKVNVPNG